MKTLAQGFNTAAQDSNPGSRSRESEALPLSNCALILAFVPGMSNKFESNADVFALVICTRVFSFRQRPCLHI